MKDGFSNIYLNSHNLKKTDIFFIIICLIFLYLILFILPAYPIFFEEDHLSMIQDAWRMYQGEAIYRDFFQFTFPGTQATYYLLFIIFGVKFWLINLMIMLLGIASVIISIAISRKIIDNIWYSYLPSCLYLFFGFRWFGLDGSHRMFSPVFAMLAVLVLLDSRTYKRLIIAGAFCALISFFTQQRGFLAVGAIVVFLIFDKFAEGKSWKKLFWEELTIGSSFIFFLFILLLPFIYTSGIERFLEYTIFYISYYVQDSSANYQTYFININKIWNLGYIMSIVMFFYLATIPLIYLITYIYLFIKRRDESVKHKSKVLFVALIGSFLSIGTFAPNPGRYYQISVPALILLVWFFYQISAKSVQIVKFAVIGLIIFGLILSYRVQTAWDIEILKAPTGNIAFLSDKTAERYKWLEENADKNDTVFEVYLCAVNFPLSLKNPTRITFLLNTAYTPKWMVFQAIEDLERKKTKYIIWDDMWTEELKELGKDEKLNPLYNYLKENYTIKKNFTPYNDRRMQLWERDIK